MISEIILSLLAELDKADRAFCFTSGMAALAAVTHLFGTGALPSSTFILMGTGVIFST